MRLRLAIGSAALAALALMGCAVTTPDPQPAVNVVDTFNDGFMEAKQDDCDQGFAPACEWLAAAR